MKPTGHWHTYEQRIPGPGLSKGRTSGGRKLWVCTSGCSKRVWTNREEGPADWLYPWGLTARHAEVLTYLVDGRRAPYIAYHMGISIRMVQNYVSIIKRAMGGTLPECIEAWREFETSALVERV